MSQNIPPWGRRLLQEQMYSLPPKVEVSAPSLDTSSQASVEEMETSQDSNPINIHSPMAAGSNHSDSPTIDLTELQANANLAASHMLSIKRSLGP